MGHNTTSSQEGADQQVNGRPGAHVGMTYRV